MPSILHVIAGLGMGGAERTLTALVSAKRRNLNNTVVDLIGSGDLAPTIRKAGIPVIELGMRNAAVMPIALFRLTHLIRTLRPDIVQSWLYYADLLSLWALERSGRRSATRLYWGIRCSEMSPGVSPILRRTIAACARRSQRPDCVIANSYAGREVHLKLGYVAKAFEVIPNGVDLDLFRPDASIRSRQRAQLGIPQNAKLVIHVARVDPMKDHASLLAVAAALPNLNFLAIGQGTEHLPAPRNMIALGKCNDVAPLFAAADLALSTSAYGEGFPNVIAEAMASGLPTVATDVGDAGRIIADTGAIVRPRDVEAMVVALRGLADEPESDYRRRSSASRERIIREFSFERFVASFEALYTLGTVPKQNSSVTDPKLVRSPEPTNGGL